MLGAIPYNITASRLFILLLVVYVPRYYRAWVTALRTRPLFDGLCLTAIANIYFPQLVQVGVEVNASSAASGRGTLTAISTATENEPDVFGRLARS